MRKREAGAPKVSIIIATYNWSAALDCALRAVRRQTLTDFEVLVVGDGCTDDSAAVVEAFADSRFFWHNLSKNHGNQWAPNNFGLDIARGEWIAYCGHDDIWHPDHLATLVDAAEAEQAVASAATMIMYGPPGSGVIHVAGLSSTRFLPETAFMPPSGLLHRRDVVETIGRWTDPDATALPNDCEFQLRLARRSPIVATNQLTVFKFNAAVRRDSYITKRVDEQQAMLAKIERGGEIRLAETIAALQAFARGQLRALEMPDISGVAPGAIARINRRAKGTEARFHPSELVRPDEVRRFGAEILSGAYEWHEPETHPTLGSYRWSGPATRSVADIPVILDRRVSILVVLANAITPEILRTLSISINGHPTEFAIEHRTTGEIDLWMNAEPGTAGPLAIAFEVDRTLRPCDLVKSADRRSLGIAVARIEIAPARRFSPRLWVWRVRRSIKSVGPLKKLVTSARQFLRR